MTPRAPLEWRLSGGGVAAASRGGGDRRVTRDGIGDMIDPVTRESLLGVGLEKSAGKVFRRRWHGGGRNPAAAPVVGQWPDNGRRERG
ncbi:hypothetical protein Tco_0683017 [Tanacetum coccineum]|uniref:Uncharacterized protein n=1 Tax=Tanacetum coccineum TaxID=301880 RepID=A0ABQ4XTY4_9ASTR